MSLRVLRTDSQGRWKDGQPSWELLHQRKRQPKNQNPSQDLRDDRDRPDGGLYNAKGDLVAPPSSLDIDI